MNGFPTNRELSQANVTLARLAYATLANHLRLLGMEMAMECGPYRPAAKSFTEFAIKTRQDVLLILKAKRLFMDAGSEGDGLVIELQRLLDRIERDIISPLQDAAKGKEATSKVRFRSVAAALTSLLRDLEKMPTAMQTTERTVVVVDVVGYSNLASTFDSTLGVEAHFNLNDRIQRLLVESIGAIGKSTEETLIISTGDGAILAFEIAADAHKFAEKLQRRAIPPRSTKRRDVDLAFRIGISSGQVAIESKSVSGVTNIAGAAIIEATRLASACKPSEVLISESAWSVLPQQIRSLYASRTPIPGKPHERISVHSYQFLAKEAKRGSAT